MFMFTPIWGRCPIWLSHIFQRGWFNHQLGFLSTPTSIPWKVSIAGVNSTRGSVELMVSVVALGSARRIGKGKWTALVLKKWRQAFEASGCFFGGVFLRRHHFWWNNKRAVLQNPWSWWDGMLPMRFRMGFSPMGTFLFCFFFFFFLGGGGGVDCYLWQALLDAGEVKVAEERFR